MEQHKISRKNFWDNGGKVSDEMTDYTNLTVTDANEEVTATYEWFTLFCC